MLISQKDRFLNDNLIYFNIQDLDVRNILLEREREREHSLNELKNSALRAYEIDVESCSGFSRTAFFAYLPG